MSHGEWLAVHLPGQQGLVQGAQRHRALDDQGLRIEAGRQGFATGGGDEALALGNPAKRFYDCLERHPAPEHAAGGADRPGRAAGAVGEERAAVARALQHAGHGCHAEGSKLGQGQAAWLLDALEGNRPPLAVGEDGRIGGRQVVAHEQPVAGGDHAGADGIAVGFQRVGAVHDQRLGSLPLHVVRQGHGFLGLHPPRQAGQADGGDGGGRSRQQVAAAQIDGFWHGASPGKGCRRLRAIRRSVATEEGGWRRARGGFRHSGHGTHPLGTLGQGIYGFRQGVLPCQGAGVPRSSRTK
ncbi:hypothetical protein D3C78_904190 [compost metagenome]